MKTLKFRCWNGEQMVSPDYITREGLGWWKENSIPTHSTIIMQSTGILDKHGKEVFEGDIIKTDNHPDGPVVTISDFYRFIYWSIESDINATDDVDLEIIGNIYENKNLLDERR